ncbi:MAG: hypothetical protein NVS3B12_04810 [Acidimicrobiales bacterium]
MTFIAFMASPAGRIARIVAGLALIVVGIVLGGGWLALVVVGLVPLAAGVFDFCIFAPLFRLPLVGNKIRSSIAAR